MQFNITFKTIFECVLKKLVLCIQIRFVSTEKTTRIASRASCSSYVSTKLIIGHIFAIVSSFFFSKKLPIVVVRDVCPSVRPSVCPSVCPSVRPSVRPSVCRLWK